MLEFDTSTQFRKDYGRLTKSSRYPDFEARFQILVSLLLSEEPLPARYKEHKLIGKYVGCHECHLAPDLMLIYKYGSKYVQLVRLGTHADLF
jgi:mRNA interferase YafQ